MTLTINSLLDGPVESVECLDTDFTVVVSVRTALEEELDQGRNVRAKDGNFENPKASIGAACSPHVIIHLLDQYLHVAFVAILPLDSGRLF